MIIDYVGVKEINGSLIVIDGVKGVSNEEIVDIKLENGSQDRVVSFRSRARGSSCRFLRAREESASRIPAPA